MKIRMNELFSGIGAQYRGICETGLYDCTVTATAEIDANAIISYAALHCGLTSQLLKTYSYPDSTEMRNYLTNKGIVSNPDSKVATDWYKAKEEFVRKVYLACQLSKNCGDISKVERLPQADLWTYSFPCFPMGTLVYTIDGYKPIETVERGDRVVTHKGRYCSVLHTSVKMTDELYEIHTELGEPIKATANHPFYVKESWGSSPRWCFAAEIQPDWLVASTDIYTDTIPIVPLSVSVSDKAFWGLLGYYVRYGLPTTEDSITFYKTGANKNNILYNVGQLRLKYTVIDDDITVELEGIGEYCSKFGKSFKSRHLTRDIMNLPVIYARAFLNAFLNGKQPITGRVLAYDISALVFNAYSKVCKMYRRLDADTLEVSDEYAFEISEEPVPRADGYAWSRVTEINKKHCKCPVYNMTVADDNTYVVQNIVVHNCQDLSQIGQKKGIDQGTRSGLLFEVGRLLGRAKADNTLPKYLLMENVPALTGKKNKPAYDKWLAYLKGLGYTTSTAIVSGTECNVPQNRKRCFALSILNSARPYVFPESKPLKVRLSDILEKTDTYLVPTASHLKCSLKNAKRGNGFCFTVHNPSRAYVANTITTRAGSRVTDNFVFLTDYDNDTRVDMNSLVLKEGKSFDEVASLKVRKLTPSECFSLMGFKPQDVKTLRNVGISDTTLYRLAGNSIIVNCISEILRELYKNKY